MRGTGGAFLVAFVLLAVLSLPALADETATVTATVTPSMVRSVSLDTSSINYGSLTTSASDASRTTKLSSDVTGSPITATVGGNVSSKLLIYGSNATAPPLSGEIAWELNCDPGDVDIDGTVANNQYVHRYHVGTPFVHGAARTICTSANQKVIASSLTPGSTLQFVLQLNMPTGTNGFSQRSFSVTVVAVAP